MKISASVRATLRLSASALTLGIMLAGSHSMAQGLEEIVVTANKRGEASIQDIPLSVQSVSGDRLAEAGSLAFDDYFRQIPGLSVNDQGPGDKQYNIRGINSTGAGTVGLYFDEIIITDENISGDGGRQPDIKLFDMDRIEVLRGPQGTTFGSSSLSGTIRWIPKAPDLNNVAGEIGASISQTKESGDLGWTLDGMINVPVVSDKLAVRFSGMLVDKAGYIDDRYAKDVNNDDTKAARAMLRWRATDELEVSLMAMFQDMKTDGRSFFNTEDYRLANSPTMNGGPLPSKYFTADPARGGFDDKMNLYNAKITYAKDWGTFTATSSIYDRKTSLRRPASAAAEILSGGAYPADSTGSAILNNNKDRSLFSNELRFASSWDSPVQVLAGVFYQEEERWWQSRFASVDRTTGLVSTNSTEFLNRQTDTTIKEKAAFGEVSWEVLDGLTVTGGVRIFDFKIEEQANVITRFPALPGAGLGPIFNSKDNGKIFKGNISYQVTDDFLLYGQIAEGFRAGGTNDQTAASIVNVVIPAGYSSDSLVNYEAGFKSSWFDNRLIINSTIYYIDWSDIQVEQAAVEAGTGISFAYRGNGGGAEVKGIEFELSAYPTDGLSLGMGVNYLKAELTEDMPLIEDGRKGDAIPYVPDLTLNFNARYEAPLPNGWNGFVGGDWSYVGSISNRLSPTDRYYREAKSYTLTNLRVGVKGDDWSATLAVNNVFDEDSITMYAFDFQGPPPPGGNVPDNLVRAWPRTISLTFRKTFW